MFTQLIEIGAGLHTEANCEKPVTLELPQAGIIQLEGYCGSDFHYRRGPQAVGATAGTGDTMHPAGRFVLPIACVNGGKSFSILPVSKEPVRVDVQPMGF